MPFQNDVADFLVAVHQERKSLGTDITGHTREIWKFVCAEKLVEPASPSAWVVSRNGVEWLLNNGFGTHAANIIDPHATPLTDTAVTDLADFLHAVHNTTFKEWMTKFGTDEEAKDVFCDRIVQVSKDGYVAITSEPDLVETGDGYVMIMDDLMGENEIYHLTPAGVEFVKKHRKPEPAAPKQPISKLWGTW